MPRRRYVRILAHCEMVAGIMFGGGGRFVILNSVWYCSRALVTQSRVEQASVAAAHKNTPGKDQCGVGMILKQTADGLVVKKLVDGAPAQLSAAIELGDVLFKVDGKKVSTAEEAAAAILGDRGSVVHFQLQREWEGKTIKFPVKLERNKPVT